MKKFEEYLDVVFNLYGYESYFDRRRQVKRQLCRVYYRELSDYTRCEAVSECHGFEDFVRRLMCSTDIDCVFAMRKLQDSVCNFIEDQAEELHDKRLDELKEADRINAGAKYVSFLGDLS